MILQAATARDTFPETKFFFPEAKATAPSHKPNVDTLAKEVFANSSIERMSAPISATVTHQVSTPEKTDEAKVIANHSGVLWECIGRRAEDTGYIYLFKIRGEFNLNADKNTRPWETEKAIRAALLEVFPAIELDQKEVQFLNHSLDQIVLSSNFIDVPNQIPRLLWFLGYESYQKDGVTYLELPDKEALTAKWNLLIEKQKTRQPELQLRPLKIISSSDIAEDAEFIEAYFHHDALLSTGKEFVHDHLSHLIPLLVFMLNFTSTNVKYEETKKSNVEIFKTIYERISRAKKAVDDAIGKGEKTLRISTYDCLRRVMGDDQFDRVYTDASLRVSFEALKKNLPKLDTALASIADIAASKHSAVYTDGGTLTNEIAIDEMMRFDNESTNYFGYFGRRYSKGEYVLSLKKIWDSLVSLEKREPLSEIVS